MASQSKLLKRVNNMNKLEQTANSESYADAFIMLIDDSDVDTYSTRRALKEVNSKLTIIRFDEATSAKDYLLGEQLMMNDAASSNDVVANFKQISNTLPKLILLDLNMPGMDGFELLSILKANTSTQNIPVIIMSNSANDSDVEKSYRLGANGYIVKPMEADVYTLAMQSSLHYWLNTVALPNSV